MVSNHQRSLYRLTQVGLFVFPQVLPPVIQTALLDRLLHREIANPVHMTNLHPFYPLPYQSEPKLGSALFASSFFGLSKDQLLLPMDPTIHKPLSVRTMLQSKLRWATLGGQYDWTRKEYPKDLPPAFPPDIAQLLRSLFPEMLSQAAIVNFYSPGDTLSMHRDVSEDCDRGLVSISIGCDAIFMVTNDDGTEILPLRVKSGDAIFMNGPSRFAWHGVPRIIRGTCPEWLRDWPALGENQSAFGQWRGWMETKRINLNVRQMSE